MYLFWKTVYVLMINLHGWPLASAWATMSLVPFVIVGALWLPVVGIQIVMSREATRVASVDDLPAGFHRRFLLWFVLGIPAFLIVVALFYLMIAKPLPVT